MQDQLLAYLASFCLVGPIDLNCLAGHLLLVLLWGSGGEEQGCVPHAALSCVFGVSSDSMAVLTDVLLSRENDLSGPL